MKGGEGEGRIHVSYPSVQQYISASPPTEMYRGIKTFIASTGDGCQDIKSHLISDAKKKIQFTSEILFTSRRQTISIQG